MRVLKKSSARDWHFKALNWLLTKARINFGLWIQLSLVSPPCTILRESVYTFYSAALCGHINHLVLYFFHRCWRKRRLRSMERERCVSPKQWEEREKNIYTHQQRLSHSLGLCVCVLIGGSEMEDKSSQIDPLGAHMQKSRAAVCHLVIIVRSRCMHVPKIKSCGSRGPH